MGMNNKVSVIKFDLLDRVFVGLLLVIFAGIVVHAPLTVWLGTFSPDYSLLIKSWKELLMILATLFGGMILYKKRQLPILTDPLIIVAGIYAAVHVLLLPVRFQGIESAVAGLFIDLRYVLFFVLVYIAVRLYPQVRRPFLITGLIGALVVTLFGLLQVFVLPPDILQHLGYGPSTIMPYLTIDQNEAYIRINSTLRGPNSLGAYAAIVLALVSAFWIKGHYKKIEKPLPVLELLLVGTIVCVWVSYSRSALVAAGVGLFIVLAATVLRKSIIRWVASLTIIGAVLGSVIIVGGSDFVSNVLLHENLDGGSSVSSNDGHVDSLQDGSVRLITQPFGGGIGSTGSASLLGDSPLVIENQYLFIAHEVGWLGLICFLLLFGLILRELWWARADWLALGVFASGIGIGLMALLLPIWADDTVAIIWWGLVAIALASRTRHD